MCVVCGGAWEQQVVIASKGCEGVKLHTTSTPTPTPTQTVIVERKLCAAAMERDKHIASKYFKEYKNTSAAGKPVIQLTMNACVVADFSVASVGHGCRCT